MEVIEALSKDEGGRPVKQTEEVVGRILLAIRSGNTLRASAAFGGVSYSTLNRWSKEDPAFAAQVEAAEAEAEMRRVRNVTLAADDGTWQAAAWWLERRRHEDWGRKDKLNLGGDGAGGAIPVELRFSQIVAVRPAGVTEEVPALEAGEGGDADAESLAGRE